MITERSDIMATFSFDREFKLTVEEADRLAEIMSKPVKRDDIKPYTDADREECRELLKKYWFKNKEDKTE